MTTFWHHELVGARLIEAAFTMRRLPMRIWPKQFGTIWPSYDPLDDDESEENGGRYSHSSEPDRVRISPTASEIERAEEALGWLNYLRDDEEMTKVVGHWANTTYDLDAEIPAIVRPGLKTISRGLKLDQVKVRR